MAVAMYAMRLHSVARKHYTMRSVLRRIFWSPAQCIVYEGRCVGTKDNNIYIQFTHSFTVMWGSLRLAPIIYGDMMLPSVTGS